MLALGRTEGQLNELRSHVADSTSKTELSIIQVLELWQDIFRETFEQYHRLSTRLVRNEDRASALNLWHDYLLQVQLFLSESLPDNYVCLNEYRNLCEVHQCVLTSQQSILTVQTSAIDTSLTEKFKHLSKLHNETLSRISDRHAEIVLRIKLWNKYKTDQSNLLIWLKEKEREKSRLQLRYIHLQRIPQTLHAIQNMIEQMEQAEIHYSDLKTQQDQIIQFCNDSAKTTSLRMEIGSIGQRFGNLRASLETWKDFLCRISGLSATYDHKVNNLESHFQRAQDTIYLTSNNKIPQSVSQSEQTIDELRSLKILINSLTPELETVSIIQEELKECICPTNIKVIRRTMHVLWQQQADIDHQLTDLISKIDDRCTMFDTFTSKYERLTHWMDETEARLGNEPCYILYDSEEMLRRFETDLQSEFELREREKVLLLSIGRELLTFYTISNEHGKLQRIQIKEKIDTIVDRWENLKIMTKQRINKIQEFKMTILRLENRIATIRAWIYNVELELTKPIIFESSARSAFDKIIQENELLQRAIEKESSNIGEVLNLCEMVFNDSNTWKTHIDSESLSTSIETLEHRWKYICNHSVERKQKILTIWSLLMEALRLTNDLNSWVNMKFSSL